MSDRSRVAILLADSKARDQAINAVKSDLFEPIAVDSTDALYREITRSSVDYVLVDQRLTGYMTGLEVLERTFRDLGRPTAVLCGELGECESARAYALGVAAVLSPEADAGALRTAFATFADQDQTNPQAHPRAEEIVDACRAEPMPQLVVKLAGHLARQDEIAIPALAKDVATDATVTAGLIKMSNSAAFCRGREIKTVFDAINMLGVRRTLAMVLTLALTKAQRRLTEVFLPADRLWYNRRAVMTASTASAFAELLSISGETAYLLGLFQELGILVMAEHFGDRYHESLVRVRNTGPLNLAAVEQSVYGVTHADVGGSLLRRWRLPTSLVVPVTTHHRPKLIERLDAETRRYLQAMQIAEASANLLDGHATHRYGPLRDLLKRLGQDRAEECSEAMRTSAAKAAESSRLFRIPIPNPKKLAELTDEVAERYLVD